MATNLTRAATVIVAASNSPTPALADVICSGTNDQLAINAAIAGLPTQGGRVILLGGTYNISASIIIDRDRVTLAGEGYGFWGNFAAGNPGTGTEGAGISKIKATAATNMITVDRTTSDPESRRRGVTIQDLYLYGYQKNGAGITTTANAGAVDQMLVERVFVHNTSTGFNGRFDAGRVTDSTFMDLGSHAVWLNGSSYYPLIANNCIADIGGGGVLVNNGATYGGMITNNSIVRSSFGVGMSGTSYMMIGHNMFSICRANAVGIDGCSDTTIDANIVQQQNTVNSGIEIGLSTACPRTLVTGNNVRQDSGSNTAHYAVNAGASSTGYVNSNIVSGAWNAAPVNAGGLTAGTNPALAG